MPLLASALDMYEADRIYESVIIRPHLLYYLLWVFKFCLGASVALSLGFRPTLIYMVYWISI